MTTASFPVSALTSVRKSQAVGVARPVQTARVVPAASSSGGFRFALGQALRTFGDARLTWATAGSILPG